MAPTRSDSPVSRRIVRSFLEFLANVRLAPGTDREGLELARECLTKMFKVDAASPADEFCGLELLVDFVESLQAGVEPDQGEHPTKKSFPAGSFKDEIFRRFHDNLQDTDILAIDYRLLGPSLENKQANAIIHEAIDELEDSGCSEFFNENVAETLKSRGNRAMESGKMLDAIRLYTCAIALCAENPVYYANRAGAFTEMNKYQEAIDDCAAAIHFDPNYWKAYCRLGAVHFALGRYTAAIMVFQKALELNPDNASITENIQLAEQKLHELLRAREENQNPGLNMSSASNGTQQLPQNELGEGQNQTEGGPAIAGVNLEEGTPQNSSEATIKEKIQEAGQKPEEELRRGEEQNPSLDGPGVQPLTDHN